MSQTHSTTFVFIKEDAKKRRTRRSDRATATSVQRKAQSWAAASARKRKLEALLAGSAHTRRIAQLGWKSKAMRTADQSVTDCVDTDVYHGNPPLQERRQSQIRRQLLSANFCPGDSVDPFGSLAVPIDQDTGSILQFYKEYSVLTASFDKHLLVPGQQLLHQRCASAPVSAIVHECMHDHLHMYALLTVTAACMSQVSEPRSRLADTYMQEAVRLLRAYLMSTCEEQVIVKPQIILDILYLAMAEWYRADYDAALTHFHVLSHLVNMLDLSSNFDGYVYEMMCNFDIFICVETGSAPLFPLTWETSKMTRYQKDLLDSNVRQIFEDQRPAFLRGRPPSIPASKRFTPATPSSAAPVVQMFTEALYIISFESEMHAIFSDLAHLMHVALSSDPLSKQTGSTVGAGVVCVVKKSTTLLSRLLFSSSALSHFDGTSVLSCRQAECCRLAAILTLSYLSLSSTDRAARINTTRLRHALSGKGNDSTWGSQVADRLLLWVLTTGLFFLAPQQRDDQEWFRARANEVATRLGICDYPDLHCSLQRYLQNVSTETAAAGVVCTLSLGNLPMLSTDISRSPSINTGVEMVPCTLPLRSKSPYEVCVI